MNIIHEEDENIASPTPKNQALEYRSSLDKSPSDDGKRTFPIEKQFSIELRAVTPNAGRKPKRLTQPEIIV